MTILTPDMVEKGARAMWEERENIHCFSDVDREGPLDKQPEMIRDWVRRETRACLTAVLPDVIERCAKVAETEADRWAAVYSDVSIYGVNASEKIATAIRSLSQGKE